MAETTVSTAGAQQSVDTYTRSDERRYTVRDLRDSRKVDIGYTSREKRAERIRILECVLKRAKALRNSNSTEGMRISIERDFKLSDEEIEKYEKELSDFKLMEKNKQKLDIEESSLENWG